MENLIHITFDKAGAGNLKQSFDIDDIIAGEIVLIEDDLAFGPLKDATSEEDLISRQSWWNQMMATEAYLYVKHDHELLTDICQRMREDEDNEIWIWVAQNTRDVCGYYSLLHSLSDFSGRVYLIYLNNLPFINEKGGIFYPTQVSEILPKEFLKARKLARAITPSEAEADGEEWDRLKEENASVRILEGAKKISSRPDDYFDSELINRCRLDFVKGWRLVTHVQQKGKDYANEIFLYSRLQFLIESGILVTKGEYKNLKECEIRTANTGNSDNTIEENNEPGSDH